MVTMVSNAPEGAQRDELTGLPHVDVVKARISRWQTEANAAGRPAPVHALLLGLRRFDTINMTYGEAAGDAALVEIAARVQRFAASEFSDEWIATRLSGGTFLVAAHESCSRERWQWLAEALGDAVSRPIGELDEPGAMRIWPRLALMRALPIDDADAVLHKLADTLQTIMQRSGRRAAWVDGDRSVAGRNPVQLETDLTAALQRGEIEVLYQPQYRTSDDALIGAEALARWQHPQLGRIGAGALFAVAERSDQIAVLSRHIAERALSAAARWPDDLRLSLNVTPTDIAQGNFARDLAGLVQRSGFDPNRLTVEIVEQALLTDLNKAAADLQALTQSGIRIALDDFGAGFCNFRYLKVLPLHYLKLDKTMVEGVASDERDLVILRGILAMARALGLSVIAEGIESEPQRAAIQAEACDYYQGFLRAQPMSEADFAQLAAG